jgi:DUF4097 and DUF4098 domain-containing protein YvlB
MPTFDTPTPISVTLDLGLGAARIVASDRTDTVLAVHPSDPSSGSDVRDAEQTRVEYSNGRLLVQAPKRRAVFGRAGSIDVTIELPAGSHVHGDASATALTCDGRLGECRFKTAAGDIRFDETGALRLSTSLGDISVERAVGHADVSSGSGTVSIRAIDGTAAIKTANGDIRIGEITGELRSSSANGDISVDRAHAAVDAKTARGSVRIGEVVRGSVGIQTAVGELEVGIREGTAAWLDVSSRFGHVHNSLGAADGPEASDETVEVRARTSYGDVVIRRS